MWHFTEFVFLGSSFEAPKNMMLADKFTLGYAHLVKELRECNNIHVAEAHMLVVQMSNRFGFKFPYTTPSTMDDFLKMLSTFSLNNCFNPRLIDMLINYFNINCLKSFVPSLRETHSSVTVMEVVSTMPGEVEDIVVVQKDRHTRFQSDELTLLEVIGDEASVFASLENKTLYLHPAVRFHGNVIDVPSYILAYVYKYIADCSTDPMDFKVSRHLSTVYMHLGNYKIDLYNTHKGKAPTQYNYVCIT